MGWSFLKILIDFVDGIKLTDLRFLDFLFEKPGYLLTINVNDFLGLTQSTKSQAFEHVGIVETIIR